MSTTATTTNRSDHDLQQAIQQELEWTPDVEASGVGFAVDEGVVTLSGEVESYTERRAAKNAVLRVSGVSTVIDDVTVQPTTSPTVTEADIAKEVKRALTWAIRVPETVKAEIKDHAVTLTGQVRWDYQRQAARRAVESLRGVSDVANCITLTPRPSAADAQQRIVDALTRNAQLDAEAVSVTVSGTSVTLTGHVRSWAEKQQAEHAARASPHVTAIENLILVQTH